jgi:MFS family permease
MKKELYTTTISIIVALGGFALGYDFSVISGAIPFLRDYFQLSEFLVGWVTSSLVMGVMFGNLTAGFLSDRFGRKNVLLATAFLFFISGLLCAIAPSLNFLIMARIIGGIAIGWAILIAPVYIAEIAPAKRRGRLVAINQLTIMLGISVAYFINLLVLNMVHANHWRWMLGLEAIPGILYFIFLFFVPESPRWLMLKGQVNQASAILRKIGGEQHAAEEIRAIQDSIKMEIATSFTELFKGKLFIFLLIGIALGSLQQLIGINAIFYYAPDIFEKIGGTRNSAFLQASIIGIINIVFTVLAMRLIDRIGRKPLLIIGISGIILCHLIVGFSFARANYSIDNESKIKLNNTVKTELVEKIKPLQGRSFVSKKDYLNELAKYLSAGELQENKLNILKSTIKLDSIVIMVAILAFVAMFAMSLGPVTWVLLSELYPNKFRGRAISIAGFFNGFSSFIVPLLFLWEFETIGEAATFLIFASIAIVCFFFVIYKIPETKGKSLEEIEATLIKKS